VPDEAGFDFERQHIVARIEERRCQLARAGADLDHEPALRDLQRIDDIGQYARVPQEVLPEGLARAWTGEPLRS
jgi:hypothetical protein